MGFFSLLFLNFHLSDIPLRCVTFWNPRVEARRFLTSGKGKKKEKGNDSLRKIEREILRMSEFRFGKKEPKKRKMSAVSVP